MINHTLNNWIILPDSSRAQSRTQSWSYNWRLWASTGRSPNWELRSRKCNSSQCGHWPSFLPNWYFFLPEVFTKKALHIEQSLKEKWKRYQCTLSSKECRNSFSVRLECSDYVWSWCTFSPAIWAECWRIAPNFRTAMPTLHAKNVKAILKHEHYAKNKE